MLLFRFRNKYHPGDALVYQKKLNNGVKKRASVFIDLLESGWFDKFTLTADQGEEITKLLDAGWESNEYEKIMLSSCHYHFRYDIIFE